MPRKPPKDPSEPEIVDLGALASKKNFDSYYTHPYTGETDVPFFNFLSTKGKQSAVIVVGSSETEDSILSPYDDQADMGAGNDIAVGGPGNDTISGGEDNDYLFGDTDLGLGNVDWDLNDVLNGDSGDDLLVGDSPTLFHNAVGGDDVLTGGTGNDTLWGDGTLLDMAMGGADIFVFGTDDGQDVIKDFRTADDDQIQLFIDQITWDDLDTNNSGTLDGGDNHVDTSSGSTLIDLGAAIGGDAGQHTVLLEGVLGLTLEDFTFVWS